MIHGFVIAMVFVIGSISAGGSMDSPQIKLSDHVGKTVTLRGRAVTSGPGPSLETTSGTVFILEPKAPQSFKSVLGNAPTTTAWPDEIEGQKIEVTGILEHRKSPDGYTRPGDGKFIKSKKKGPGEYVLKSVTWTRATFVMPEVAPDNVRLGPKIIPTSKSIENTDYETETETEWGATVSFMKDGKLKIKVTILEAGDKHATTNFRKGTWKIEENLVVLVFDNSVAKFEFHPAATADWFVGKVDVLEPVSSDKKSLLHNQRLFRSPLKRK